MGVLQHDDRNPNARTEEYQIYDHCACRRTIICGNQTRVETNIKVYETCAIECRFSIATFARMILTDTLLFQVLLSEVEGFAFESGNCAWDSSSHCQQEIRIFHVLDLDFQKKYQNLSETTHVI